MQMLLAGLPQELIPDEIELEEWISPDLSRLSSKSIRWLLTNRNEMMQRYKMLRVMLAQKNQKRLKSHVIQKYKATLFLNEILCQINDRYRIDPCAIDSLKSQHEALRKQLFSLNGKIRLPAPGTQSHSFMWLHRYVAWVFDNLPLITTIRLSCARLIKLMTTVANLENIARLYILPGYVGFVRNIIQPWVVPIFSHLGWIGFIPRLSALVIKLIIHVIPGFWMPQEQKNLGIGFRLSNELRENWAEWVNDIAWISSGIAGVLFPVSFYFTLSLFYLDIFIAGIKSILMLMDLYATKAHYRFSCLDMPGVEPVRDYVKSIDEQIFHQQLQVALAIIKMVLIFLGNCILIPLILHWSPFIIPVASAAIVLGVTLVTWLIGFIIEKNAPSLEMQPASELVSTNRYSLYGGQTQTTGFNEEDYCIDANASLT